MKRRIVSVLMALVMVLSLLPVQALAEDAAVGEPVTEIEQAEQTGKGEEPGDPEEQTGEGEEPGDPEEEQEPGEPEEPVREFVQGEAQLTVSTAAMAAGTAGETTELADIHIALSATAAACMWMATARSPWRAAISWAARLRGIMLMAAACLSLKAASLP